MNRRDALKIIGSLVTAPVVAKLPTGVYGVDITSTESLIPEQGTLQIFSGTFANPGELLAQATIAPGDLTELICERSGVTGFVRVLYPNNEVAADISFSTSVCSDDTISVPPLRFSIDDPT